MAVEAYNSDMVKRTSLNLDMSLVDEAREVLGTRGTTETVHRALAEAVRQARLQRLAARTFHMTEEELDALRRPENDADEPPLVSG